MATTKKKTETINSAKENLEKLLERMSEMGVEREGIEWYLDTRRYGGCVHSGFGMGFERLIMYLTGVDNIRDVIAFPKTASASCLMTEAPNTVDNKQLEELGIKIEKEE